MNWMILISVIVGLGLLVLLICVYDLHHLKTVYYRITTAKCKKNTRIALLSDLHDHKLGEKNQVIIDAIERENPDVIVIAGDLITSHYGEDFTNAIDLLKGLVGKYPIYYGCGNHETKIRTYPERYGDLFEQYTKALDAIGIKLMHNQIESLDEFGISIYGLELPAHFFTKFQNVYIGVSDVEREIGRPSGDQFRLLIGHNPEYFETYAKWGADLVVAGHQHGGIARIPFVGGVISTNFKLFPKYDGGFFCKGDTCMVISRGLGTHTIPVRFCNPCELVMIDLFKE